MLHFQYNVVSVLSSRLPLQDMSHEQILSTEAVLECYAAECSHYHGYRSPEEIAGEREIMLYDYVTGVCADLSHCTDLPMPGLEFRET